MATGLAAFIETPGASARPVEPRTPNIVRDRAPAVVLGHYQAVTAFEGGLDRAEVATLHELRIAAKWLRYTLEFVREPMGAVRASSSGGSSSSRTTSATSTTYMRPPSRPTPMRLARSR